MILNIKKDIGSRAVLFENLAKILIRRQLKNNFIFMTRRFDSFDEIILKYKLNISKLNSSLINFLNKNFYAIDLIAFDLNNKKSRNVIDIFFYEVKTKNVSNKSKLDICFTSLNTYKHLKKEGFRTFLASFILFEDWRYSFNIHNLNLNNFRLYSRYKNYN